MRKQITDGSEILFRQIHPHFYSNGKPASNRFLPSKSDEGKLSVDRSSLTTAEQSHGLYTSNGKQSVAVFGLSVAEFGAEGLRAFEDPLEETDDNPANPAHALVDYRMLDKRQQKEAATRLAAKAIARGCLHTQSVD